MYLSLVKQYKVRLVPETFFVQFTIFDGDARLYVRNGAGRLRGLNFYVVTLLSVTNKYV